MQRPFVAGRRSVPEPDVAIVPGRVHDYAKSHPTTALLIVEVAEWSLAQDRITKAAIYAGAGIPEYWIVNLRADCVEVLRDPEPEAGRYRERAVVGHGERLALVAFPNVRVAADDFLPGAAAT